MAFKGLLELTKAAKNYGNPPLPGSPMPANVPGAGPVNIGPNPAAEQAAIQYSQSSGIPYTPVTSFMPADPQFGARVAREYELMPHDPTNRRVQQSYGALADEIAGQYEAMLRAGIKPEFNQNPYPQSPYLGLMDMLETGRLQVYPTRAGFGMDDAFDASQNLLLAESPFKISGQPATYNDLFRAVHDFQGHAKVGAGFRSAGEEMAYLSHAGTMSPDALKALASETRGQNSWLNYGPFGDANRTAGIDDTVFAEQKSGLLPNWAIQERLPELDARRKRFNELRAQYNTGLEGAIDDSGNLTLVHYSPKPIERVDPNFYGKGLSGRTREELNRSYSEDFVPRSYYGIEADVNPYRKELGLGSNKVQTQIDAAQIYDPKKDPEGLWKDGKRDVTKSEKNLWDKGYSGYFVDHSRLGKVAIIFDPLDVTKKLMVPLVPTAAAGLTALAPQEADASILGSLSKLGAGRQDLLGMAQKMANEGMDVQSIRGRTGWEIGADGQWRTELPNTNTKINIPEVAEGSQYYSGTIADVIDDPELLSQYEKGGRKPTVRDMEGNIEEYGSRGFFGSLGDIAFTVDKNMPEGQGFHREGYFDEFGERQPETIVISGKSSPAEQRATLLHELQHSIQDREGFAAGGNQKQFAEEERIKDSFYQGTGLTPAGSSRLQELEQKISDVGQRSMSLQEVNDLERLRVEKQISDRFNSDTVGAAGARSPYGMYKGLMGEVEARNVETRDKMSPDFLRATPLELSEDVFEPRSQQIFRAGSDDELFRELEYLKYPDVRSNVPEYREAPVVREKSFGDMINEYARINQRAQAADAQKFGLLMAESSNRAGMNRKQRRDNPVSQGLMDYSQSQIIPTVKQVGSGVLEGLMDFGKDTMGRGYIASPSYASPQYSDINRQMMANPVQQAPLTPEQVYLDPRDPNALAKAEQARRAGQVLAGLMTLFSPI